MTCDLKITFPIVTGNHYKTLNFARRRVFVTKKGQMYRRMVLCDLYAKFGANKPEINKPLKVEMTITPPDRRRRDTDNIEKVLFDALTLGGLWIDDKLIVEKHVIVAEPCKPGWIDMRVTTL